MVYRQDKVALDTDLQKTNGALGDKCCGIDGWDVVLTWETRSLRGIMESQARLPAEAIVPYEGGGIYRFSWGSYLMTHQALVIKRLELKYSILFQFVIECC